MSTSTIQSLSRKLEQQRKQAIKSLKQLTKQEELKKTHLDKEINALSTRSKQLKELSGT